MIEASPMSTERPPQKETLISRIIGLCEGPTHFLTKSMYNITYIYSYTNRF